VYCDYPYNFYYCKGIFHKGAVNTIIKLPHHVSEGLFARVVSMEPEHTPLTLPAWAIRKRDTGGIPRNGIYRLKIGSDFHQESRGREGINACRLY